MLYGKRCLVLATINLIPTTLFLTRSTMVLPNNNFGIDVYAILLYRHQDRKNNNMIEIHEEMQGLEYAWGG